MNIKFVIAMLLFLTINTSIQSKDSTQIRAEAYEFALQKFLDSIEATLKYETTQVALKEGIATITIPKGFKYLNGQDSEMILTDIWGNPPSEEGFKSLGMLIPADQSPLRGDSVYSINITFSEEGYIDDDDAKDIDYDELLTTMQDDLEIANEYRKEHGYPTAQLVGWASAPYYDESNKKLHWAKEIKFGDSPINTLNYNIRILGRKGYLQLNAIGEMDVLSSVKNNINPILSSVNFNDGHKYTDFNPDIDEIAAYGIGGLIAGKVLAKAGILAKLGILLAKFWKIIVFGGIALIAGAGKIFRKS